MQLADYYALCAVYYKASALGHQIDVAHKNSLLLRAVFFAQAECHKQRYRICRPLFYALDFTLLWPHQIIGNIFKLVLAVVAFYRKNLAKYCVQSYLLPLGGRYVFLEKIGVAFHLIFYEIRKRYHFP